MANLLNKKCVPCEGGTKPLTPEQATAYLELVPGWKLTDNVKIERAIVFKDFTGAIDFINQLAQLAEAEGHHPDFHLTLWNHLKIVLWTHAISGLSENDFIMAAKANLLLRSAKLAGP